HAIIGEHTEHHRHLRVELILCERLEQHLLSVNMGQPSSPDGVVALWRDPPGNRSALKARIAEQLRNRICAHFSPSKIALDAPHARRGLIAVEPPGSVMNSRRLIALTTDRKSGKYSSSGPCIAATAFRSCPLRVRSGRHGSPNRCPLCLPKRTCDARGYP